jgi:hypothetical protein
VGGESEQRVSHCLRREKVFRGGKVEKLLLMDSLACTMLTAVNEPLENSFQSIFFPLLTTRRKLFFLSVLAKQQATTRKAFD